MDLHFRVSASEYNNNLESQASIILKHRPRNVDWSYRVDWGSKGGTDDAVAYSTIAAVRETVPTPAIMARMQLMIGTDESELVLDDTVVDDVDDVVDVVLLDVTFLACLLVCDVNLMDAFAAFAALEGDGAEVLK